MLTLVTIAPPNRVTADTAQPDPEQPAAHGGRLARPAVHGVATVLAHALAVALTVALGVVVVASVGALAHPGPDPIGVRAVDWIRDHGGGPVINTLENWWYTPRTTAGAAPRTNSQYTWRSGIGVDPAGELYYVAGDQLTLRTLARALAAAGAVRGMELDIHPNMVHLFVHRHGPGSDIPVPTKLLANMGGPTERYLVPDLRDFVAITQRRYSHVRSYETGHIRSRNQASFN
jgi:hypothetical protein